MWNAIVAARGASEACLATADWLRDTPGSP
jgi:hypothetical protein